MIMSCSGNFYYDSVVFFCYDSEKSRNQISDCRNVSGLGKSVVVFRLFEKLRYSNERSTKFESLNHKQEYLEEENGKMGAFQISPKIESSYGLGRRATKL